MRPVSPYQVSRMLSKGKRPFDPKELAPPKRLRANVQDIYANNQLSALRTQELINDIAQSGVSSFEPLAKPPGRNTARDLKRTLLKRNQWPDLYWARVRVKDLGSGKEEQQSCAFLLPHEYIATVNRLGTADVVMDTAGLDPRTRDHLERAQLSAGCPLMPLGIWGDGVPVNYDRTESVEVVSMNFPGQVGKWKPLRLPVTAVSRKQFTENTWHDIMEVVAWSLRLCAVGRWAHGRHDDEGWWPSDASRARKSSKEQALGIRAALVELRGDWKFFGETFNFPKWNTASGICWRCTCTPAEVLCKLVHISCIQLALT